MKRTSIVFLVLLFVTGCVSNPIVPKGTLDKFPVKIGILADTQKTTDKETYENLSFRSPSADKVSSVSIRPPGLEYLTPSLLAYFLEEMINEEDLDLILYLGDAANSGCEDEINDVFNQLASVTNVHKIPTYFVIGNHDYLGTGNQTLRKVKKNLCGRKENGFSNKAMDKDDLIRKVIDHNRASAKIDKTFNYVDKLPNFDSVDKTSECDESHNTLYYAAALKPKDRHKTSIDILLADTSDYNNVWFRPLLKFAGHCEVLGGAGLKGSMSYEQINDLQALGCNTGAPCHDKSLLNESVHPQFGLDYRIVASHYDPASFNALYPWNWSPSFVKDNLGYLLSNGDNIWLGAHHHSVKPLTARYPVGKTFFNGPKGTFSGFSVGSTTDYYPHAAIVEPKTWFNGEITSDVGYRTIKAPDVNGICHDVFSYVEKNNASFSEVVCGSDTHSSIKSKFGINKLYEKRGCWKQSTHEVIQGNIDKLVSASVSQNFTATQAKLCLAVIASHEESDVLINK